MRWFVLGTVILASVAGAEDAHAQEPPAQEIVVEDRGPNRLLLATGIATFGFTYLVSGWVGITTPRASEHFLVVPLVGPWMALAEREHCGEGPVDVAVPCHTEGTYVALLVVDGILQGLGAAQIALSFVKREKREVERPRIVPLRIDHGAGVAAVGTF